jgi:hypothetical protein
MNIYRLIASSKIPFLRETPVKNPCITCLLVLGVFYLIEFDVYLRIHRVTVI